jgi:hypothetical protein
MALKSGLYGGKPTNPRRADPEKRRDLLPAVSPLIAGPHDPFP